jgi:hypothetical protein
VKALTADDKHAMLAATIMTSSKLLKPDWFSKVKHIKELKQISFTQKGTSMHAN